MVAQPVNGGFKPRHPSSEPSLLTTWLHCHGRRKSRHSELSHLPQVPLRGSSGATQPQAVHLWSLGHYPQSCAAPWLMWDASYRDLCSSQGRAYTNITKWTLLPPGLGGHAVDTTPGERMTWTSLHSRPTLCSQQTAMLGEDQVWAERPFLSLALSMFSFVQEADLISPVFLVERTASQMSSSWKHRIERFFQRQ